MKTDDFGMEYYKDKFHGETVYECKGFCIKKQEDNIFILFDDPVDKKCRYLAFNKDTALEFSSRILELYRVEKESGTE
jgi:hypothetical protein